MFSPISIIVADKKRDLLPTPPVTSPKEFILYDDTYIMTTQMPITTPRAAIFQAITTTKVRPTVATTYPTPTATTTRMIVPSTTDNPTTTAEAIQTIAPTTSSSISEVTPFVGITTYATVTSTVPSTTPTTTGIIRTNLAIN